MLNDAVSIVLAATAVRHSRPPYNELSSTEVLFSALTTFCSMFMFSAMLGVAIGLISAFVSWISIISSKKNEFP